MLPKLVRNKIPDIIRSRGRNPITRPIAGDGQYRQALIDKMFEEILEYRTAETAEDRAEELADMSQVLRDLCALERISPERVEELRLRKEEERGGFDHRLMLEKVL
jgi:predicted house-cleaning noncanonical NTP pyrophosphatase (MazG superfamily)